MPITHILGQDFDIFKTPLHVSKGDVELTLLTRYQNQGKESYWLKFQPNHTVDSQDIGSMITQVLPNYPACPLEQVDGLYARSLQIFRSAAPSEEREAATKFVLATRLVKAYNEDFTKGVAIKIRNLMTEYAMLRSVVGKGFQHPETCAILSGALQVPLSSIERECQEYLRTIPQNSLSSKAQRTIEKIHAVAEKLKTTQEISSDLQELQNGIRLNT